MHNKYYYTAVEDLSLSRFESSNCTQNEERFRVDRNDALFNGTFIQRHVYSLHRYRLRIRIASTPGRIYYIEGRIVDESIRENACIAISQQDDGHGRIHEWSTMFFSLTLSIRPSENTQGVSKIGIGDSFRISRLLTTKNSSQSPEHDRSIIERDY